MMISFLIILDFWNFIIFKRQSLTMIKFLIINPLVFGDGTNPGIIEKELDIIIDPESGADVSESLKRSRRRSMGS